MCKFIFITLANYKKLYDYKQSNHKAFINKLGIFISIIKNQLQKVSIMDSLIK